MYLSLLRRRCGGQAPARRAQRQGRGRGLQERMACAARAHSAGDARRLVGPRHAASGMMSHEDPVQHTDGRSTKALHVEEYAEYWSTRCCMRCGEFRPLSHIATPRHRQRGQASEWWKSTWSSGKTLVRKVPRQRKIKIKNSFADTCSCACCMDD